MDNVFARFRELNEAAMEEIRRREEARTWATILGEASGDIPTPSFGFDDRLKELLDERQREREAFLTIPEVQFDPITPADNIERFHACRRVYDAAFQDLVASFHIPAKLLAPTEGEAVFSSSRVASRIFEQRMDRLSHQVIENLLSKPEGELICTSSSTTTESCSFAQLKELMASLPKLRGLASLKLRSCPLLGSRKQFRFPKSKKRRIRKKWAKRPTNYRFVPDPNYYIIGDVLTAHPEVIAKIKSALPTMESASECAFDWKVEPYPSPDGPDAHSSALSKDFVAQTLPAPVVRDPRTLLLGGMIC